MEVLFLKKTKISIFGRISKFLELIVSGQILAVLGNFRHFGQIWTNIASSMPKLHLRVASHCKATNNFYLHFKSQLQWKIIVAACPN
jgi:hypothetical protein